MFEVTPDDIALLNDADLRELVGRLSEAELRRRGLPTSAVKASGHQDASDAGLDVIAELPAHVQIEGWIPRPITGFQVKKHKMAKGKILAEMCPSGEPREIL